MNLTVEQVAEMAPDPAAAAAGKKLVALKLWSDLGRSPAAIWGKCQGSALYQVKIDLANMGTSCSCPSRKFPCKHALGLLRSRRLLNPIRRIRPHPPMTKRG
jgi:uncharacterized Zn finger protein